MKLKSRLILFTLMVLSIFFLVTSCEAAQNVQTAASTTSTQDVDGTSLINNWNFKSQIRNDQANAPYDWWIWEAAKYGVSSAKVAQYGVKDGYVYLKIEDSGSDTWHIQFNQWVKLTPTKSYYISFKAKSDVTKKVNVKILQTHDPWTNYFAKTIELSKDWQTYEFYYVHSDKADETVTFGFELGKTENTTVYISDVIIKPVDKSQVPPEYLPPEEEVETIEYSFEDEEEPHNLVNNGDFSYKIINDQGSMPSEWWIWQASQYGISSAKISEYGVKDGAGFIALADTGTESWHIQFNQWIKLRKGNSYKISFKAKSDEPRSINVKFVQTGAPYGTYFSQTVNLTQNWHTFEFEYTHPENGDPVVTLSFELGKEKATVIYFDDVTVAPKK